MGEVIAIPHSPEKREKSMQDELKTYGPAFRAMAERVSRDPKNVFGDMLISFLLANRLPLSFLQKFLGLHGQRVYNLFERTDRDLLFEAEIIYRLAYLMQENPVELYALYLESHGQYEFPTLRGPYQIQKFTPKQLARLAASFDLFWNMLINTPTFTRGSREEQSQLASQFASLWDAFSLISPELRDVVLRITRSFLPPGETSDIDPIERSQASQRKMLHPPAFQQEKES